MKQSVTEYARNKKRMQQTTIDVDRTKKHEAKLFLSRNFFKISILFILKNFDRVSPYEWTKLPTNKPKFKKISHGT